MTNPPKKVLLAEDDPRLARSLTDYITSLGFEVVMATNGWLAYEMLSDNPDETFFAVVSDMRMPGGSGLTFCQAANRHKDCPPTLIHSSDVSYREPHIDLKDISELMEYFDFVKETHRKSDDFSYIKKFLNSIS